MSTPDAPFRASPPAPAEPRAAALPVPVRFTLANGVEVLLVERHTFPIVDIRVMTKLGVGDLPERPSVLAAVAAMLDKGTSSRSRAEIEDAFKALGAEPAAWFTWDSGTFEVKALASAAGDAIDLVGDCWTRATFPQAEVARMLTLAQSTLRETASHADVAASNALAPALFGRTEPYGHALTGRPADVSRTTRAELVAAYRRAITPASTGVVVVGDIPREALEARLAKTFGVWRAPPEKPAPASRSVSMSGVAMSVSPHARGPRLVLVDRPGAPQSEVRVANVAFAADDARRVPAAVLNAVLGGDSFTSRLNLNLREQHHYSYWVWTDLWLRHTDGMFEVGAAVATPDTGAAVTEILRELARTVEADVPAAELAGAKASLIQSQNGKLAKVQDVAQRMGDIFRYGFADDELATLPSRIDAVTTADVRQVAARLFDSIRLTVLVVGDLKVVRPQLEALAPRSIEVRDAYGDEVAPSRPTGPRPRP